MTPEQHQYHVAAVQGIIIQQLEILSKVHNGHDIADYQKPINMIQKMRCHPGFNDAMKNIVAKLQGA